MGLLGMRCVLCADAISDCHRETLDLYSTAVLSLKRKVRWTSQKLVQRTFRFKLSTAVEAKGALDESKTRDITPPVGHIAEIGQTVAVLMRDDIVSAM